MNENSLVKEGNKLLLDSIATNMKIFVPMLASRLSLKEQYAYDDLTDDKFEQHRCLGMKEILNQNICPDYSTTPEGLTSCRYVKIRILHSQPVDAVRHPQTFD